MTDLSSVTLKVGMTVMAWTDVSEMGAHVLRVEASVTVLSIDEDSVTLAIEQSIKEDV